MPWLHARRLQDDDDNKTTCGQQAQCQCPHLLKWSKETRQCQHKPEQRDTVNTPPNNPACVKQCNVKQSEQALCSGSFANEQEESSQGDVGQNQHGSDEVKKGVNFELLNEAVKKTLPKRPTTAIALRGEQLPEIERSCPQCAAISPPYAFCPPEGRPFSANRSICVER